VPRRPLTSRPPDWKLLSIQVADGDGQEDKRTAIKEAKRALDEGQKSYKSRVKEARDELSRAEQARERELGDASGA